MKKYMIGAAIAAMSMTAITSAHAGEQGAYAGVASSVYNFDLKGAGLKSTTVSALGLTLGYDMGTDIAFELRAATSIGSKDVVTSAAQNTALSTSIALSYLIKPYYGFDNSGYQAYGLIGATTNKFKSKGVAGSVFSRDFTKTSFSYGLGFEGDVAKNYTVGVEWFRPATNVAFDSVSKLTINQFSLTGNYKF